MKIKYNLETVIHMTIIFKNTKKQKKYQKFL